jgi:hypothetical protein
MGADTRDGDDLPHRVSGFPGALFSRRHLEKWSAEMLSGNKSYLFPKTGVAGPESRVT